MDRLSRVIIVCMILVAIVMVGLVAYGGIGCGRDMEKQTRIYDDGYCAGKLAGYERGHTTGAEYGYQLGLLEGEKNCRILAPGTHTLECYPCPSCEECSYWIKVEEGETAYYVNLSVSTLGLDGVRNIRISKDDRE